MGRVVDSEKWRLTFYPGSIETIPSEGKDLLRRLLEVNPRLRLKSVMALQKISMYMKFNVEENYVLNQCPLKIMEEHGIHINSSRNESAYYQNF